MDIVKDIVDMIDEEIEGAENYARCAISEKTENPTLAKVFGDIAGDELRHIDMLHAEVVTLIKRLKERGTVIDSSMLQIYNYLHEKAVDDVVRIKALLAER